MIRQGIILKINNNSILVLEENGQYLSLKKKEKVKVGKGIIFTDEDILNSGLRNHFKYYGTAVVLLLAVLGIVLNFYSPTPLYSIISIDINPSLEIFVDEFDVVQNVISYNKEGDKLIDFHWKEANFEEVFVKIINNASGYYDGKHRISIGVIDKFNKNLDEKIVDISELSENLQSTEVYIYRFEDNYVKEDEHKSLINNYKDNPISIGIKLVNKKELEVKKETIRNNQKKIKELKEKEEKIIKEQKKQKELKEKDLEKQKNKDINKDINMDEKKDNKEKNHTPNKKKDIKETEKQKK